LLQVPTREPVGVHHDSSEGRTFGGRRNAVRPTSPAGTIHPPKG
jgi:hypothetical protein